MIRHFTTSVYIVENQKVLMLNHPKLQKWLPPGGHVEANETPTAAAMREVLEETGYEIEFIRQENVWIKHWNATSFERPYLCLLEEIPETASEPAHQHIDFVYLARPLSKKSPAEKHELRWFSLKEINAFIPDHEIFQETQQVLNDLLSPQHPLVTNHL